MTHDQLLRFLTRCVRDGVITERRAAELLLAFDNGTLNPADLPEDQEDSNLIPILLLSTSLLVRLLRGLGYSVRQPLVIPHSAINGLKEALREEFKQQSRRLAFAFSQSGDMNTWQSGMANLIKRNMVENAIVGAGRNLTAFELSEMTPLAEEQMAFLARFADSIALGNLTGKPMSLAAIVNRANSYVRIGIALGDFMAELAADYGPGWIVDYIARDDPFVCSACLEAEAQSPFLPAQGIFPAEVCFGGDRCRCKREARYDPVAYAAIVGADALAA